MSATLDLTREPLRDAAHVADLLGVPVKTIHQYARDGRLPSIKLGRHRRFVVADVERALEEMREG